MIYRPNEYVSVRQVAEAKGVDVATVRRACEDGRLPATMVDTRYIILWRDAEPWEPLKPGPKAKQKNAG